MTGPLAEDLAIHSLMGSTPIWRTITIAATTLTGAATPLTPSTIQPLVVQLSVHDTPSASGSSCMPLISMLSAAPKAPTAVPLISMSLAAPAATQLAAAQFAYMANPSWEASQREQFVQNQLLQERQQLEAWKAHHAQPQPQVAQRRAPPLVPLEPTVIVKAPVEGVEVISVRLASAKTEDCSSRPGID